MTEPSAWAASLAALDEGRASQMSQVRQHDDVERGWGPARPREAKAERMAEGGHAERGEVCASPPSTETARAAIR